SRRRRRPADAAASAVAPHAEAPADDGGDAATTNSDGGYGKAALVLALVVGTLIERLAAGVLPTTALDVFHLVVAIAIAFLVARWYRGFMRQTLGRARNNRLNRTSKRRR
ncbi:MAG: hypothetical protein O3A10_13790, partial [Chloroflexi bacterium]|nr:hypothetical protein [Chloroflexota bacterium]